MTRYVVFTPAAGYTGPVGKVHFQDGVAEVDDAVHAAELGYMRSAGYHVQELDSQAREDLGYTQAQIARIEAEEQQEAVEADSQTAGESASDEVTAGPTGPEVAKPKKTAPVADWRAYARSQGMSADDADGMTKNQLVERFADEEETA